MKKIGILILAALLIHISAFTQDEVIRGKNNLSLMMSDVLMKRISIEYEHIMGENGNMSINLPASVAIGEQIDVYDDNVKWWAGLGMKFYPTGQGTIRYFVGPEVRIISANNTVYDYESGYTREYEENLIHTAFLLNNGMIYEPTKGFIFTVSMGLGFMSKDKKSHNYYSQIMPMATPSVRIGVRF